MAMDFSAAGLYGGAPVIQPTPTGRQDHPSGTPDPNVRTLPRPGATGNPTLALVALVALAALVITRINR